MKKSSKKALLGVDIEEIVILFVIIFICFILVYVIEKYLAKKTLNTFNERINNIDRRLNLFTKLKEPINVNGYVMPKVTIYVLDPKLSPTLEQYRSEYLKGIPEIETQSLMYGGIE